MALRPWIVRRAALNERKPPIRRIDRFTRKWSLSLSCCRCWVTSWSGVRGSRLAFRLSAMAGRGGVVRLDPALPERLLDVTVTEEVARPSGDDLHDQGSLRGPTLGIGLGARLQLRGDRGQDHGPASRAMAARWSGLANDP